MELSDLDSISMNADLSWNQRKIPGMNFVIFDCKVYFVIQDSHCILQGSTYSNIFKIFRLYITIFSSYLKK